MINKYVMIVMVYLLGIGGAFLYGRRAQVSPPSSSTEQHNEDVKKEIITEIIERPGEKRTIIKEVEVTKVKTVKAEVKAPNWFLSLSKDIKDNEYTINVNRRVLGNVFIGGYASTAKEYGITVGVEF